MRAVCSYVCAVDSCCDSSDKIIITSVCIHVDTSTEDPNAVGTARNYRSVCLAEDVVPVEP